VKWIVLATGAIFLFITLFQVALFNHVSATNYQSDGLPSLVQAVVNSAVDLEYYNNSNTSYEKASGVKIGPNLTISAGHEFLVNGPIQATNTSDSCRNTVIYSPNDKNTDQSSGSSVVSTYQYNDTSEPDVSFIKTEGDSQFNNLPTPSIGSVPSTGNKLFLINYEPDSSSEQRNPNSYENLGSDAKALSYPAIYSAVVLSTSGGRYTIATGIKSYGNGIPDTMSRPGASGGPVFNSNGQLIGAIVSTTVSGQISPQLLASTYGVNTESLNDSDELQIEQVQPITTALVNEYTNLLSNESSNEVMPADTSSCVDASSSSTQNKKPSFIKSTMSNVSRNFKKTDSLLVSLDSANQL
jgi:hypothetical protein